MTSVLNNDAELHSAIESCAMALRRDAEYRLDPALDRRMLDLGERKELLTPGEHAELRGLVTFTQQRSIEKLEAQVALNRLKWEVGSDSYERTLNAVRAVEEG